MERQAIILGKRYRRARAALDAAFAVYKLRLAALDTVMDRVLGTGIAVTPVAMVHDRENPRGLPASDARVTQLRELGEQRRAFVVFLDYVRQFCLSEFRSGRVGLKSSEMDILRALMVRARKKRVIESVLLNEEIAGMLDANSARPGDLVAKAIHSLRNKLGVHGVRKKREIIVVVPGKGYRFDTLGQPYCLIDHLPVAEEPGIPKPKREFGAPGIPS